MTNKNYILYFLLLFFINLSLELFSDVIPFGNGAWVYDATYSFEGKKEISIPGIFTKDINDYNTVYANCPQNQINQILTELLSVYYVIYL